jgi:hypothetical protein
LGLKQRIEIAQLQAHCRFNGGPTVTTGLRRHRGKTGAEGNGLPIHQTYCGPLTGLDLTLQRQQGVPHVHGQRPSPQALERLLVRRWRFRPQTLQRLERGARTHRCPVRHGLCEARLPRVARGYIAMNQGDLVLIRHTGL